MTHGDLERWIESDGRELLCAILQGHLDWRGPGRVEGGCVIGADDIARTHRRERPRGLLSVVGEVVVPRTVYERPESEGLCPRDAELNLPPTHYSHGVVLPQPNRDGPAAVLWSRQGAPRCPSVSAASTPPSRRLIPAA
jgi:hypothetical protein